MADLLHGPAPARHWLRPDPTRVGASLPPAPTHGPPLPLNPGDGTGPPAAATREARWTASLTRWGDAVTVPQPALELSFLVHLPRVPGREPSAASH